MATYLVAGVLSICGCEETRRGIVGLKGLGRKAVIVCVGVQVQQHSDGEFQRLGEDDMDDDDDDDGLVISQDLVKQEAE